VTAIGGRLKPEFLLLAGADEMNALAQGALRQFTQWLWQFTLPHLSLPLPSTKNEKTTDER